MTLTPIASGFSGADIWRLGSGPAAYCLRAWPAEMRDRARLDWMHAVLRLIHQSDCPLVPVPRETIEQTTWVEYRDRLWEMTPWLPGRADYRENATPQRLRAALLALAQFHISAARVEPPGVSLGYSPTLRSRVSLLDELQQGLYPRLCLAVHSHRTSEFTNLADPILRRCVDIGPALRARTSSIERQRLPLQICHGDLWHDHLLLIGDRVTGLIDFGNLRVDSPLSDVARLLGSLAGDDASQWQIGLEAYQELHPLSSQQHDVLRLLDQTTVLLSGVNWLRWIFLQRRQFTNWPLVEDRVRAIVARLDHL